MTANNFTASGTVVLPDDSANLGKSLDESIVTINGVQYYRQRTVTADALNPGSVARVFEGGVAFQDPDLLEVATKILWELRKLNHMFGAQCGQSMANLRATDFDLEGNLT